MGYSNEADAEAARQRREPCHSPAAQRLLEPHQHASQRIRHRHHHAVAAHFESADLAFTSIAQGGAADWAGRAGQAYLDCD